MANFLEIDLSKGYYPVDWIFHLVKNDEIYHLLIDNHSIFYTNINYITFDENILTISVLSNDNILNINFILASEDERKYFHKKLQRLIF